MQIVGLSYMLSLGQGTGDIVYAYLMIIITIKASAKVKALTGRAH